MMLNKNMNTKCKQVKYEWLSEKCVEKGTLWNIDIDGAQKQIKETAGLLGCFV